MHANKSFNGAASASQQTHVPLNESIARLIVSSCLLEPSLSHIPRSPVPPPSSAPISIAQAESHPLAALLGPKQLLWASAGSMALVAHCSSLWKTVPPIFFLAFVISYQATHSDSDDHLRKLKLIAALEAVLSVANQSDLLLHDVLSNLSGLEESVAGTALDAFYLRHSADDELAHELDTVRQNVESQLRQTMEACAKASEVISESVASKEQLQGLLDMHHVTTTTTATAGNQDQNSEGDRQEHSQREEQHPEPIPLRLPRAVAKSKSRPASFISDGGVLPTSPDLPLYRRRRPSLSLDSNSNHRRRNRSSIQILPSTPPSASGSSRHAVPPRPLGRSFSARAASRDSPSSALRKSVFSPPLQEAFDDSALDSSYAKLTQLSRSPAAYEGIKHAHDHLRKRLSLSSSSSSEPKSAPLPQEDRRLSHIGAVTGWLPPTDNAAFSPTTTWAKRHDRRMSQHAPAPSSRPFIFAGGNGSSPFQTQSGSSSRGRHGSNDSKRYSLLSQQSHVSSALAPAHEVLSDSGYAPDERSGQSSNKHAKALEVLFDRLHCERRRMLCCLMAVDVAHLLGRSPNQVTSISAALSSVSEQSEHLQLVLQRELDRLAWTANGGRSSCSEKRESWSPLLPGAWTHPSNTNKSRHLSPWDLPGQQSSPVPSAGKSPLSTRSDFNFAPEPSTNEKQRSTISQFDGKSSKMSRSLRSIEAKLSIASEELHHRNSLEASHWDSMDMEEGSRAQELLTVHDSIRADIEGLLRDWDESRVLLRLAVHPEPARPREPALPEHAAEAEAEADEASDEPSLTHSTRQHRNSSIFSSEITTPDQSPPQQSLAALFHGQEEENMTPTAAAALDAPEQVFEADVATADKTKQKPQLSREERIRLMKEKRAVEKSQADSESHQPNISGEPQ